MKNNKIMIVLTIFATILFVGCAAPRMALLDVQATTDKIVAEKAYNNITSVIIENGFDVKVANKDLGFISTEYKKFGAARVGRVPYNFSLQIKTQVKTRPNGKLQIKLTPIVKIVNRANAADYSEIDLTFLTEEEQGQSLNAVGQTFLKGQIMFMNVLYGVAEVCGLGLEELEYNKELSDIRY